MRIAQKQTHIKRNTIISIIVAIVAAGLVYAWFSPSVPFFGVKPREVAPENTIDYNKATGDQKSAGEAQKKSTAPSGVDAKPESGSDSSSDTGVAPLSFSITTLSVTDGTVQIRTLIDTVNNKGECTLKLTKGDATIVKRSGVYAGPSSSTCEGFNFPASELSSGEWKLDLTVNIEGRAASVTRQFTV